MCSILTLPSVTFMSGGAGGGEVRQGKGSRTPHTEGESGRPLSRLGAAALWRILKKPRSETISKTESSLDIQSDVDETKEEK